mmetsp:Transcript_38919/g.63061  ORF Transcript_38919/g.63061 Transcript_38919/m.63061 type:complete len:123 (-) Transcript_38919:10-378(-)
MFRWPFGDMMHTLACVQLPMRYTVILLCCLSLCISNADRVNFSVAIIGVAEKYGFGKKAEGILLGAFFWGSLLAHVPGGFLSHRYGGKVVLGTGVIVWSFFTWLTVPSIVMSRGIWPVFCAR